MVHADWLLRGRGEKRVALPALWEGNNLFSGPVSLGGKCSLEKFEQ